MRPPYWPRIAGIILGIFREIPTVHNLPFTAPVPARAWLLVGPAHIYLYINAFTLELVRDRQPPLPVLGTFTGESCTCTAVHKNQDWQAPLPVPGMVAGKSCACTPMFSVHSYFSAFTLELVRDRQPPLPVPSMVAGESCACTPMSRSELAQDRWPTLPVPARSELAQDWWPTLPVLDTVAGESCTHTFTLELAQDWWPTLPVLDTVASESCTHTHMHNLASYLLLHFGSLHWNWFRTGGLHCLFWVPSLENPASVHLSISIYIGNGSGLEASAGPPPLV
ncbi:hypothetical protein B0H13DRAFT_1884303 [Mycena leptocephala]|nr:hypothetical protein B0H13DRAFT_1884303 [Mycena leptocephala]